MRLCQCEGRLFVGFYALIYYGGDFRCSHFRHFLGVAILLSFFLGCDFNRWAFRPGNQSASRVACWPHNPTFPDTSPESHALPICPVQCPSTMGSVCLSVSIPGLWRGGFVQRDTRNRQDSAHSMSFPKHMGRPVTFLCIPLAERCRRGVP
jgi:hypothetical protein